MTRAPSALAPRRAWRAVAAPSGGDSAAAAARGAPATAENAPGDGAPGDGAPGDGAPSDGAPSDGAPGDGAPSEGASGEGVSGARAVAEETAIAFVYDHSAEAVMMASPTDLEDFAVGFSLNEGVIAAPADIASLEVLDRPLGVELRMHLVPARGREMARRRRHRAGPVGCGLCGVESIEDAMRPSAPVASDLVVAPEAIIAAIAALAGRQPLNDQTRAVHAAALFRPGVGITHVREDVGRHNALDKLAGALARDGVTARDGVILVTSRLSVELVQKAAAMGAPVLAAVSAPTALAIRTAADVGMTLVAVVRADGLEVFTHDWRVRPATGAGGER